MAMTSRDVLPANKIDVEVDGASPFVRRLRADVVLIRFPSLLEQIDKDKLEINVSAEPD